MKMRADWLLLNLAPPLAAVLIRLIGWLSRKEIIGASSVQQLWQRGETAIIAAWHDQLLLNYPIQYQYYVLLVITKL